MAKKRQLTAYDMWDEDALPIPRAPREAKKLAQKISTKRRAVLRRTTGSDVSKAAARHERSFSLALKTAARLAQETISIGRLSIALESGNGNHITEVAVKRLAEVLSVGSTR